jgi:hypothetical protein
MADPLLAMIGATVLCIAGVAAIISLGVLFTQGFLAMFRAMHMMK